MIYVIQGGRCGNQLFNYAFTKKIKKIYNGEGVCFMLGAIKNKSDSNYNGDYWEDSLKYFKVENYQISYEDNIILKKGSLKQIICYYFWRCSRKINTIIYKVTGIEFSAFSLFLNKLVYKVISKFGLYFITHGFESKINITKEENKFIYGSFEDERWFSDVYNDLVNEIAPKSKINHDCQKLYNKICFSNAICVSLRKWSIDVHQSDELEKREICDEKYYKKAIEEIIKTQENPVFFVFSDDMIWAGNLVKSIVNDRCEVVLEFGDNNVAEKIFLMSACKHFIIANSTFSWWAAYLSQNKNKIVFSPNIWFKTNSNYKPLILRDWKRINCN